MRYSGLVAVALMASVSGVCEADNEQGIFDRSFRTLKVQCSDDFFAPPILTEGSGRKIVVTFDRIKEDRDYLRYRLVHCNADWSRSQLTDAEIMPTFNDVEITDSEFSDNTYVHYVNYRIEIPSENASPAVSGNYALEVYDESAPDEVLLRVRFGVEEPVVEISGNADAYTDRGVNDIYQQVRAAVDLHRESVRDPYNDIFLTVEQNYSPWGEVRVIHPQRVEGERLIYDHLDAMLFRAGNEYRRFETVRADYPGMNVDSVRYMGSNYHAWLRVDEPKSGKSYQYDQTQSGRYMVREYNATDADLGADYVTVHFALRMPELTDAEVYIDGELNNGTFSDVNRMRYDRERGVYVAEIPLKQGSYNYRYVVKGKQGTIDPYFIDGDKSETRNEYLLKTFLHCPGDKYDRLVGYKMIRTY